MMLKKPVFSKAFRAIHSAWNLLIFHSTSQLFKYPKFSVMRGEVRMKRLVISCILILALTNQAYAMGSHHGGGGGGGSSASLSNSRNSNTPNNSTTNTASNITTGGNTGATGRQGSTEGSPIIVVSSGPNSSSTTCVPTPEVSTLFLLGAVLLGLWVLRRKIKI
jgi:hypothetical protein